MGHITILRQYKIWPYFCISGGPEPREGATFEQNFFSDICSARYSSIENLMHYMKFQKKVLVNRSSDHQCLMLIGKKKVRKNCGMTKQTAVAMRAKAPFPCSALYTGGLVWSVHCARPPIVHNQLVWNRFTLAFLGGPGKTSGVADDCSEPSQTANRMDITLLWVSSDTVKFREILTKAIH